jgi:hypothetical protein
MSRLNLLGIVLCVGAGCIVLFESISAMMTVGEIVIRMSSVAELAGQARLAWIDRVPALWIQSGLNYLVALPAWLVVLALGILCFIIAGIRSR